MHIVLHLVNKCGVKLKSCILIIINNQDSNNHRHRQHYHRRQSSSRLSNISNGIIVINLLRPGQDITTIMLKDLLGLAHITLHLNRITTINKLIISQVGYTLVAHIHITIKLPVLLVQGQALNRCNAYKCVHLSCLHQRQLHPPPHLHQ